MKIINYAHNKVYVHCRNGITVSMIWGEGSYSDNGTWGKNPPVSDGWNKFLQASGTVELYITDNPKWANKPLERLARWVCKKQGEEPYSDYPLAYVPVKLALEFILKVSKLEEKS